jgi:hypothetical protein
VSVHVIVASITHAVVAALKPGRETYEDLGRIVPDCWNKHSCIRSTYIHTHIHTYVPYTRVTRISTGFLLPFRARRPVEKDQRRSHESEGDRKVGAHGPRKHS